MTPIIGYLTGYLTVEITGDGAELLLNRAASQRIRLSGLRYRKRRITGYISVRDFKRLRSIRYGTGTHIKILKKHGLPFLTRRYRRRYGLLAGALIFFAVLFTLSKFVWSVEIEGNSRVGSERLISACEGLGIKQGMPKRRLSAAVDAQRLLLCVPELSWAALNLEGSVLTVTVSETVTESGLQSAEPCDLRAAADGTVTKIDITSGEPAVKVGDTVLKGDVLVSGVKETALGTEFVRSMGTVTARTRRSLSESAEYLQTVTEYTGKQKTQKVLSLFGADIPLFLGSPRGEFEVGLSREPLTVNGRRLPIEISERRCKFTKKREEQYGRDRLEKQLRDNIEKQKSRLGLRECETVSETLEETEGGLRLTQLIDSTENIAVSEKLLISPQTE